MNLSKIDAQDEINYSCNINSEKKKSDMLRLTKDKFISIQYLSILPKYNNANNFIPNMML